MDQNSFLMSAMNHFLNSSKRRVWKEIRRQKDSGLPTCSNLASLVQIPVEGIRRKLLCGKCGFVSGDMVEKILKV